MKVGKINRQYISNFTAYTEIKMESSRSIFSSQGVPMLAIFGGCGSDFEWVNLGILICSLV